MGSDKGVGKLSRTEKVGWGREEVSAQVDQEQRNCEREHD